MLQNTYLLYPLVFAVVFLGYLAVSVMTHGRPSGGASGARPAHLPLFLQWLWGPGLLLSEGMKPLAARLAPETERKLRSTLVQAGLKIPLPHVLGISVAGALSFALAVLSIAVCFTRAPGALLAVGMVGAFVGAVYPFVSLDDIATKRQEKIMRTLPFAVDLIGAAMRSGVDFVAAVRYYVSSEKPDNPLAVEFGVLLGQLELGKSRIEAMESLGGRIPNDAFASFTGAVTHGFEVGASIVDTLKMQAQDMRRVRFSIAERKAARATSAMILPIAVFIMPAMFVIIGTPIGLQVMGSGLGGVMK